MPQTEPKLPCMAGMPFSVDDLAELGVKRISVGGALARAALAGLLRAAHEMLEQGTFSFTNDAAPTKAITDLFGVVRKPD